MVAVVGNTVKGIININYKAIIEVFMEIYFKIITKRIWAYMIKLLVYTKVLKNTILLSLIL